MISLQSFEKHLIEFLTCMEWKLIKAHYCKGRATPPIDSDIGPISTLELSKLCKNKKIIEIQRKNWSLCLGHHRAIMYQEEKNGKGFRYLKAGQASNYPVKIETANFRASTLCKQHSNIIYVVGFPLWVHT